MWSEPRGKNRVSAKVLKATTTLKFWLKCWLVCRNFSWYRTVRTKKAKILAVIEHTTSLYLLLFWYDIFGSYLSIYFRFVTVWKPPHPQGKFSTTLVWAETPYEEAQPNHLKVSKADRIPPSHICLLNFPLVALPKIFHICLILLRSTTVALEFCLFSLMCSTHVCTVTLNSYASLF